jgi:hypothetical protein
VLTVGAVSLAVSSQLLAQEQSLEVGDRVRVTAPAFQAEPLVGTLQRLDGETCVQQVQADLLCVPTSSLIKVELSLGVKSRATSGAIYGGLAGLAAGLVFVGAACNSAADVDCGTAALFWGGVGAGAGALIGALIGSGNKSERWDNVPIESLHVAMLFRHERGTAFVVAVRY